MKIISLNLRHNNDRWEERFPLVVDALQAEQADVICFQEVWLAIQQAHLIADALNAHTPAQPYQVIVEPKWGERPVEGIGILSRPAVLEAERLDLPITERVAQRIAIEVNGRRVDIANTHLHHRPWEDESIRLPQMTHLLHWMRSRNDRRYRWLLAGDMNATPDRETIAAAQQHFESACLAANGFEPHTCPTPIADHYHDGVRLTIDYIFFDPTAFIVKTARVFADEPAPHDDRLYPSDHFGLVAGFEIV